LSLMRLFAAAAFAGCFLVGSARGFGVPRLGREAGLAESASRAVGDGEPRGAPTLIGPLLQTSLSVTSPPA
jgi:hypothetical protein